ncbi:hypothetical protein TIFTF001_019758 [Ficus carica]|uniref:Uncharacterized protein n=1 Tax=Ficus carica TaxID=3494 RepID=A0AA88AT98_FICCA|nr:hypothetical protein TIFTF001_019758 [Ficus carica]
MIPQATRHSDLGLGLGFWAPPIASVMNDGDGDGDDDDDDRFLSTPWISSKILRARDTWRVGNSVFG